MRHNQWREHETERQVFSAGKTEISAQPAKPRQDEEMRPQRRAAAPAGPSNEITPETVDRAARMLVPYVGPISAVLAKREAQHAQTVQAF
jgi:hypothetical protein